MGPSSNSLYSSIFTYNSSVLTRPYRHLTFVPLTVLHQNACISHDICISIVGFGDRACACRIHTPKSRQKQTRRLSTKVFLLFDELSDNNESDDGI